MTMGARCPGIRLLFLAFLAFKSGSYVSCDPPGSGLPYPCGPDAWTLQTWNVRKLVWKNGALATEWTCMRISSRFIRI